MPLNRITCFFHVLANMGVRYAFFKVGYLVLKRTGLIRALFPIAVSDRRWIGKEEWEKQCVGTFFRSREEMPAANVVCALNDEDIAALRFTAGRLRGGEICLYGHIWCSFVSWHMNPLTGYQYSSKQHWSAIDEMTTESGDIKHVWEISRFGFLYDLIRFDFHSGEDQSEWIFERIENWIEYNPVNCGVNWICSQEISLRILAWLFALDYYRHSPILDSRRFERIIASIYFQAKHVSINRWVAKETLRNNHAISEALLLFVVGIRFPFFRESAEWKLKGKNSLESEVARQIAPDGAYCQQSMNYHRVLIQLLTYAIQVARIHKDDFSDRFYQRSRKALDFLVCFQSPDGGFLPDYGPNDGALFFPYTSCERRDFTSEIAPLYVILNRGVPYRAGKWGEALMWYGLLDKTVAYKKVEARVFNFPSGYYVLHDKGAMSFIRCTDYRSFRPFQADNLHLDIWLNGVNILRDSGSYSYNTDETSARYFAGTEGHNTIVIEGFDQMYKERRFTWTHWIKQSKCTGWEEAVDDELGAVYRFCGEFTGFRHSGHAITHRRTVKQLRGQAHWIVLDEVSGLPAGWRIRQLWHPHTTFGKQFVVAALDKKECGLVAETGEGWYSPGYGKRERQNYFYFSTDTGVIRTEIRQKD